MSITRRGFLTASLAAGAAWMGVTRLHRRDSTRRVEALIDALLATRLAEALPVAASHLRVGATHDELLAAAFLLPVITHPEVGDAHAMAVIPAVKRLCDVQRDSVVPVLWAVDNARAWSGSVRLAEGPTPTTRPPDELHAALLAADSLYAERALLGLLGARGPSAAARMLALEATYPYADPHVSIFAAQCIRMLGLLGARYFSPVLRAIVRYMARRAPPRVAPAEEASRERSLPSGIGAEELAQALTEDPQAAYRAGEKVLSGALALLAIETRVADPALTGAGTHQTTLLDALLFLSAILPAAERGPALVRAARRMTELTAEQLGGARPQAFNMPAGAVRTARAAAYAIGLPVAASAPAAYSGRAAERVAEYGLEPHDFKAWAAVEDVARIVDPRIRPRWIACHSLARVDAAASRWDRFEEARALTHS